MSPRPPFLAIPRAALESSWYRAASPVARALWLELLSLANYGESTTRKGLTLKPGQLVTSWRTLAERLAWIQEDGKRKVPPPTNIRRYAAFLKKAGEATWHTATHAAGGGTVITLSRWDCYAGEAVNAASHAADDTASTLATCAATQEERDPALPSQGQETPTAKEKRRRANEETRRILEEEDRLREGEDSGIVH